MKNKNEKETAEIKRIRKNCLERSKKTFQLYGGKSVKERYEWLLAIYNLKP